jgi:hypothetical protein
VRRPTRLVEHPPRRSVGAPLPPLLLAALRRAGYSHLRALAEDLRVPPQRLKTARHQGRLSEDLAERIATALSLPSDTVHALFALPVQRKAAS